MSKENNKNYDKRNDIMAHYKKINIFGNSNVGKSTLISNIEQNYTDKALIKKEDDNKEKINENISNNENENNQQQSQEKTVSNNLIEQIKRIKFNFDNNEEINIICYETNLDNFDFITINLEALLTYSECIILMIDISSAISFTSIFKLMSLITELKANNNEIKDTPIILINNKTDLEVSRDVSGFEIKEFLDKYPSILNVELSLLSKENFVDFMHKFVDILKKIDNSNIYDAQHLVKIQDPPTIPKDKESALTKIDDANLYIFFLGSSTVGKTTFIKKFFKFDFFENTLSTLGLDKETTLAKVGDHFVKIEMWDTAGQERLRSIPKKYYSKGDGFLLLFDVTNRSTYDDVAGWIKDIRETRGNVNTVNGVNNSGNANSSNEVLFLIGNKIDDTEKRVVTQEEAKIMAKNYGVNYYEVSCKQGINVYEVTTKLIFESFSFSKGTNEGFTLKNDKSKKKTKKCC